MSDMPGFLIAILTVAFGSSLIGVASSMLGRRTYRDLVATLDRVDQDSRTTDNDRRIALGVSQMATSWTVGALALTLVAALGVILPVFSLLKGKPMDPEKRPSGKTVRAAFREAFDKASIPDDAVIQELSGVSPEGSWLHKTDLLARIWSLSWKSALYAHPFWVLANVVLFVVLWLPWMSLLWLFNRTMGSQSSFDASAVLRSLARVAH